MSFDSKGEAAVICGLVLSQVLLRVGVFRLPLLRFNDFLIGDRLVFNLCRVEYVIEYLIFNDRTLLPIAVLDYRNTN